jgi:hypothetical protein
VIKALAASILATLVTGCGGSHVLREAEPLKTDTVLLEASDASISARLDALVIRNGAGSWAGDAYWDEYRFRVRSKSPREVTLLRITVHDFLGNALVATSDRAGLIDATSEVAMRYERRGKPQASTAAA